MNQIFIMSVQLKVIVTKQVFAECKNCSKAEVAENCAIAVALKYIFPKVHVSNLFIFPFGVETSEANKLKIGLPEIARNFITLFDSLSAIPRVRLLLPEFEFEISIPDEIIDNINIDGIMPEPELVG